MLRRALSLLLVATIATCPFFCTLNGAVAKVVGNTAHSCCDCCHSDHAGAARLPNGSNHCPPEPGKCCQCICGGAISDVGSAHFASFDWSLWTYLPAEFVPAVSAFHP